MRSFLYAGLAALAAGCVLDSTVLRTTGEGVVAGGVYADGSRYVLGARGAGGAGVWQVTELGELRLTQPLGDVVDQLLIVDDALGLDVAVPIDEPLPPETEATVRACLSLEQIELLGLTWSEGAAEESLSE